MRNEPQYGTALTCIMALAATLYINTFHDRFCSSLAVFLFCLEILRVWANWRETRLESKRCARQHMRTEEKHKHMLNGGSWIEQSWDHDFDETIGVGTSRYKRPYPHLSQRDDE